MSTSRIRSKAAVSAAAAAASALAPSAFAAPIIVTPAPLPTLQTSFFGNTPGATLQLDLDGDAVNDFRLALTHSFAGNASSGSVGGRVRLLANAGNLILNGKRQTAGTSFSVGPVPGAPKGPVGVTSRLLRQGSASATNGSTTFSAFAGDFPGGANFGDSFGYVGVRFDISGNTHYGWIKLSVKNDTIGVPLGVRAMKWAYESVPDTTLHVAVPETPASAAGLGALALGAAGVEALRRRRSRRAA